ncbi:hypothetical protein EV183_004077 [Coemansia sp. RSA 2336]|nr:hypothetical protein EV183_004077 [Coemansia sp. RSA 2336]
MAAFSKLSKRILADIFKHLTNEPPESLADWKKHLPLLAVCHSWRQAATKPVYATVFISCTQAEAPKFHTNIDLLVRMGHHKHARKLVLYMGCTMDLSKFVAKAIEVLSIVVPVWKSINELHMELNAATGHEEQLRKLADKIHKSMPHVTHLYVNSEEDEDTGLVSALIDLYAEQLEKCESYVMVEPQTAVFRHLKQAVIRLALDSKKIRYKVPLQTLTHLYIAGDLQQTMEQLHEGHSSESIEFAQLEQLCILSPVAEEQDEPHAFASLSFPRLSVLRVNPSSKTSQLLQRSNMPNNLNKLEILTLYMGTIVLYNVPLSEAKTRLAELLSSERNFWTMADYLFGTAQLSSHAVLTLGALPRQGVLGAEWRHLTKLEVIPAIRLQALLELVPRLVKLKELVIHDLQLDEEWKLGEGYEELEILRLNYEATETNQLTVMKLLIELLPKLVSIEELFLPVVPHDFYAFVQEYGAAYPHIAGFAPDF